MAGYEEQRRGDADAYARYLAGMDASMRQKVALTSGFLLARGRVADMGMGSGSGSYALASLYPELDVVGVDLDPKMVELASERYKLENLSFVAGDIAAPVFEDGTLDAIFDSSVLHHVTSFSGYDYDAAARALEVQVRALARNGVIVVRDFVDPGEGDVWLDLPADDAREPTADSIDPRTCSTADLFERFACEEKPLSGSPGFAYERVDAALHTRPGWRRYRVSHKRAAEFLLRKDYRTDWESEVKEEYTYFTKDEFEAVFRRLGLRVLASVPLHNPWIVANRFRGRCEIRTTAGDPLDFPATNYVIVGEKTADGESVRFVEAAPHAPVGFLEMSHHGDRETGRVRDLVRRPHPTLDLLPWYEDRGQLFAIARMSYPRPILSADPRGTPSLGGNRPPDYVTEPIAMILRDRPIGESADALLAETLGIDGDAIRGFALGTTYYPSPGGVQEEVSSALIEIDPMPVADAPANRYGFAAAGRVGAIEVCQLLRAAQVGGLPDARLELNAYDLLRRLGRDRGPWIGEAIELAPVRRAPAPVSFEALATRAPRRRFIGVGPGLSPGFLSLECADFHELDARDQVLSRRALELVVPRTLSANTIAVAVLMRAGDEVLIAFDDDDLPAAQCFSGNSALLVAPAWRLPRDVSRLGAAREHVLERLRVEYDLECGRLWELGGRHHPSAGVTPEVVHPYAVEVLREGSRARPLVWTRLTDAVRNASALRDGHARIAVLRAAHALGIS